MPLFLRSFIPGLEEAFVTSRGNDFKYEVKASQETDKWRYVFGHLMSLCEKVAGEGL